MGYWLNSILNHLLVELFELSFRGTGSSILGDLYGLQTALQSLLTLLFSRKVISNSAYTHIYDLYLSLPYVHLQQFFSVLLTSLLLSFYMSVRLIYGPFLIIAHFYTNEMYFLKICRWTCGVEVLLADVSLSIDIYRYATQLLCQLMRINYTFLNASSIYC